MLERARRHRTPAPGATPPDGRRATGRARYQRLHRSLATAMRDRLNLSLPIAMIAQSTSSRRARKSRARPLSRLRWDRSFPRCRWQARGHLHVPHGSPLPASPTDRARPRHHRQGAEIIHTLLADGRPPLPGDDQAPAQVRGWERYEGFVETLGRRLQKGQSFLKEIPEAVFPPGEGSRAHDIGETSLFAVATPRLVIGICPPLASAVRNRRNTGISTGISAA